MVRLAVADEKFPEGTVTFVFTDIEGSTRKVLELGDDAWAEVLATHDRLLGEAFGDGVVVNTEGDALFVAYGSATEAIHGAVAAQRAIESHPWPDDRRVRVRIGMHTGAVLVRDGDYVGSEVHRAARISSAGHGGQIVVSEATATLARGSLPASVELVDVGLHRLKDLAEPQRLFTVAGSDLPADFPPLRSLDAFPNNLPIRRSSLVGRGEEITRTRNLLDEHRLVTLTGVGGTGKTTLALQVGAEELDRHPDGVFFVDLSPLSDPELVVDALADATGVKRGGPRSNLEALLDALSRRRCLLVVDNCEHLLDACADVVDDLLLSCPELQVLATSREPLEVEGEHVYRVPSLSVPGEHAARREVERSDAVALFVSRAQGVDADFTLTDDNATVIAKICRRLDGIPLAIEFAAARVSHLAPVDIAARLDSRFRLLTGGRRRVRRQQTLEAALDWSFDLLDEAQQQLVRRLGVFSGSFELSMAEQVCVGGAVDGHGVLDLLGSLVDKSLVTTEVGSGRLRYRLLETVRSYAEAKLHAAGEAADYRTHHRDTYLGWLQSMSWEDHFSESGVQEDVVREHDNLRAALQWSLDEGRRDLVGRMAARMIVLWQPGEGKGEEGTQWLTWALEDPDALDRTEEAACALALSSASMTLANLEQERHAARAVDLGGDLGGPLVLAYGHLAVAVAIRALVSSDRDAAVEARRTAEEGLRRGREFGNPWLAIGLQMHGQTALLLGDVEAAVASFREASHLPMSRAFGNVLYAELATCLSIRGDAAAALDVARQGTDGSLELSDQRERPTCYLATALPLAQLGQAGEAGALLRRATSVIEASGIFLEANECLVYGAAVAVALERLPDASRLLASATRVGDAQRTPVPFRAPSTYLLHQHLVGRLRSSLDREEARRHRDDGRGWSFDQAWDAMKTFADELAG